MMARYEALIRHIVEIPEGWDPAQILPISEVKVGYGPNQITMLSQYQPQIVFTEIGKDSLPEDKPCENDNCVLAYHHPIHWHYDDRPDLVGFPLKGMHLVWRGKCFIMINAMGEGMPCDIEEHP